MILALQVNTILNIQVWNKAPKTAYIKVLVEDSNGNWTFDDGSTSKNLGSVDGFSYTFFNLTLKRAVPSSDVEDETFILKFEFYKDSSYSQKFDQLSKTITVNIVDFHNPPSDWTVQIDNFDDGTAQGWSLNGFSVSNTASVQANGYSAYYSKSVNNSSASFDITLQKTFTVPNDATKVGFGFYWGVVGGGHASDSSSAYYTRIEDLQVYINDTKVYEHHHPLYMGGSGSRTDEQQEGWFNVSLDLTSYKGQNITIKIRVQGELKGWWWGFGSGGSAYIRLAIDELMFTYK